MNWTMVLLAIGIPQLIYEDRAQDVAVSFTQISPAEVHFSSNLPEGWSFVVRLDGDQNGRWGDGRGIPKSDNPTADRSFGLDGDGKSYCFQHILTASVENPEEVEASTECGRHPSKGGIDFGRRDDRSRRTMTLKLPADELFGISQTARIRICVWDTKKMTCQYTLADPFVLTKS